MDDDDLFRDLESDDIDESPTVDADEAFGSSSIDDEFDQLRQKSARSSTTYDDMDLDLDDEFADEGSGFSLSNFTTPQRLILLVLFLLDLAAIAFGVLIVVGII